MHWSSGEGKLGLQRTTIFPWLLQRLSSLFLVGAWELDYLQEHVNCSSLSSFCTNTPWYHCYICPSLCRRSWLPWVQLTETMAKASISTLLALTQDILHLSIINGHRTSLNSCLWKIWTDQRLSWILINYISFKLQVINNILSGEPKSMSSKFIFLTFVLIYCSFTYETQFQREPWVLFKFLAHCLKDFYYCIKILWNMLIWNVLLNQNKTIRSCSWWVSPHIIIL